MKTKYICKQKRQKEATKVIKAQQNENDLTRGYYFAQN